MSTSPSETEMAYLPVTPQNPSIAVPSKYQEPDVETPFSSEETPLNGKSPISLVTPTDRIEQFSFIIMLGTIIIHSVIYTTMEICGTDHFKGFAIWDLNVFIVVGAIAITLCLLIERFFAKYPTENINGFWRKVRMGIVMLLTTIAFLYVLLTQGSLASCAIITQDKCPLMFSLGWGTGPEDSTSSPKSNFGWVFAESLFGLITYYSPILIISLLCVPVQRIYGPNSKPFRNFMQVLFSIVFMIMFFALLIFLGLYR